MMLIVKIKTTKDPIEPSWTFVVNINLDLAFWEANILLLINLNPWLRYMVSNELDCKVSLNQEGYECSQPRIL